MSEQLNKLQILLAKLESWEEKIEEALEHSRGTHNFDDVVSMVLQNRVFFFSYDECFVIMEKVDFPQFSVFHCFLAGGKMEAVFSVQDEMAEVGRQLGCKYLSIAGRVGWPRLLKERGWSHVCTTMYHEIGEPDGQQQWEGWEANANNGTPARNH